MFSHVKKLENLAAKIGIQRETNFGMIDSRFGDITGPDSKKAFLS